MAWWFDQRDVRKRELADKLREMIGAAEWGEKTTIAALFGILYCQQIKAAGGAAGIAEQAGTGSTGTVNVNLGCRLADYVTPNEELWMPGRTSHLRWPTMAFLWGRRPTSGRATTTTPPMRSLKLMTRLSAPRTVRSRQRRTVSSRHQAAGSDDMGLPRKSWRRCVWLSPPVVRRFDSVVGPGETRARASTALAPILLL